MAALLYGAAYIYLAYTGYMILRVLIPCCQFDVWVEQRKLAK